MEETSVGNNNVAREIHPGHTTPHPLPPTPNVLLHSLKHWHTLGLGVIAFSLFLILTATGVLLMFYYVPSVEQAHNRMLDLAGTVAFGTLLRNMHRWAAHGMVAVVILHMVRVFFTGSYRAPREFNWVIGVVLMLLTFFASFTGYLLPWDQLAFWAITVGTAIAGYAPVLGEQIRFLLLGDQVVGQEALIRFYVLHVAVIPVAMTVLVAVHFWRIRKDGGLRASSVPARGSARVSDPTHASTADRSTVATRPIAGPS